MSSINFISHFRVTFDRFELFGWLLQLTFYNTFSHFSFEALPIVAQHNFRE